VLSLQRLLRGFRRATSSSAGQTLVFSVVGGTDAGRFAVDPASGVLTFAVAPNYESPADNDKNNVYEVVVQVSAGLETDYQTLSVTVANVNEPPVFVTGGGGANAT
jgi:hypothetical protein